jgi:hypothetical protein
MNVHRQYRLANTCFTRAAINSTDCRMHQDFGVGLDVLFYGGKWSMGGDLIIPQLGIRIKVRAGDVVIMDSGLFHKVLNFEGTRYVIVFFSKTHNEISKTGNKLFVPKDLSWLSNDMFQ